MKSNLRVMSLILFMLLHVSIKMIDDEVMLTHLDAASGSSISSIGLNLKLTNNQLGLKLCKTKAIKT